MGLDGAIEGSADGIDDGNTLGTEDGVNEGSVDGIDVGNGLGAKLGLFELGTADGMADGNTLGAIELGTTVGTVEGAENRVDGRLKKFPMITFLKFLRAFTSLQPTPRE